ncbi:MAG: phosphatidate cytidylyltransferase [Pseudomonadota bacterium]
MLKSRTLTALVLSLGTLWILLATPAWAYTGFIFLVLFLGAWEWGRLAGLIRLPLRVAYALLLTAALAAAHWLLPVSPMWWAVLALLWWLLVLVRIPSFRAGTPQQHLDLPSLLAGLPTLLPFAVLALSIYEWHRLWVLLCLLVVAASDMGAYFAGRAFGHSKLVPNVSPGKTWAGFWGGLLASGLVGTLGALTYAPGQLEVIAPGFVLGVGTGFLATIGDLNESMLKRRSGAKDSGSLLPGHGGVLDRIDSLSAAVSFFTLGLMVMAWV